MVSGCGKNCQRCYVYRKIYPIYMQNNAEMQGK